MSARDLLGVAGEARPRITGPGRRRRRPGEVDVDARGAQVVRRGAGVGAGALGRRRGGLAVRRAAPTAGCGSRRPPGRWRRARRRRAARCSRAVRRVRRGCERDVVLEQDHARGAARLQRAAGRRPAARGPAKRMTTSWPTWRRSESLRASSRRRRGVAVARRGGGRRFGSSSAGADRDADHQRERGGDHEGRRRRRASASPGELPQRLAGGLAELGHDVAVDAVEHVAALVVTGVERPAGAAAVRARLARGLALLGARVEAGGGDPAPRTARGRRSRRC